MGPVSWRYLEELVFSKHTQAPIWHLIDNLVLFKSPCQWESRVFHPSPHVLSPQRPDLLRVWPVNTAVMTWARYWMNNSGITFYSPQLTWTGKQDWCCASGFCQRTPAAADQSYRPGFPTLPCFSNMSTRSIYRGTRRKLVLAFDVGTTYSGISYR